MRLVFALLSTVLPWSARRRLLRRVFGYDLHPTSRIGLAWIFPEHLVMEEGARIESLTVCRGLELVHLGPRSVVGAGNWIVGLPRSADNPFYVDEPERVSELVLGEDASISTRHYIDCSNRIVIGAHTAITGIRSVLLTHSIDIGAGRQRSKPIYIGSHCVFLTNCVVLPGSTIPEHSVIDAMSVVTGTLDRPRMVYGGAPARPVGSVADAWSEPSAAGSGGVGFAVRSDPYDRRVHGLGD